MEKVLLKFETIKNGVYETGVMELSKKQFEKLIKKEGKKRERSGIQKK